VAKKELLFDERGFPCCCEKAQREFIAQHEQIFNDPENQPNQYATGVCPGCNILYDQTIPELARAKMCETCLGDMQSTGSPRGEPTKESNCVERSRG